MESSRYESDNTVKSDSIESIASIIIEQKSDKGRISVRGIPVNFDLLSGKAVLLEEQSSQGGVTNVYGFDDVVTLVEGAITLIAKRELLLKLHDLGDPAITKQIRANHIDPENRDQLSFVTLDRVDVTLGQLQRLSSGVGFFSAKPKPSQTQMAVAKALKALDAETVYGRNKIVDVMASIQSALVSRPNLGG